jgi:hypothetical protein
MEDDVGKNINYADNYINKFNTMFPELQTSPLFGMRIRLFKSKNADPSIVYFSYTTKENRPNFATPISLSIIHEDFVREMKNGFYTYQSIAIKYNEKFVKAKD